VLRPLIAGPERTAPPPRAASPAQLVSGAVVLQAQAVGLAHLLLVGARRHDGLAAPLAAQRVGARAEEQRDAVLLGHALQEAPQRLVALLPVAGVVGRRGALGAGDHVLRPQRAALLEQAAVLSRLQALVLSVRREGGGWRSREEEQGNVRKGQILTRGEAPLSEDSVPDMMEAMRDISMFLRFTSSSSYGETSYSSYAATGKRRITWSSS